jgi:predicted RNA binding protein YcfA (HicA-like mRNA interferase family)
MTSKQLIKLAKAKGWVLTRHGSKHHIFKHKNAIKLVTIPYHTRDHVGKQIKRQLQSV